MEKLQPNLFFPLAGVAAVASFASCSNKQKPVEQKPLNIVYIMTDDHTAQMMSCYDTRYMETPNLDRIAADGVRFTQSFVANSLSGPSRACMITGKHSCANKFYDNTTCVFDSSQQTFPKLLQKIGYQTALVGVGRDGAGQHIRREGDAHGHIGVHMQKGDEHGADDSRRAHARKAGAEDRKSVV